MPGCFRAGSAAGLRMRCNHPHRTVTLDIFGVGGGLPIPTGYFPVPPIRHARSSDPRARARPSTPAASAHSPRPRRRPARPGPGPGPIGVRPDQAPPDPRGPRGAILPKKREFNEKVWNPQF